MKETLELRMYRELAAFVFHDNEGRSLSESIKAVEISKDDPRYKILPKIAQEVKDKYDRPFFFSWQIKRKYSRKELAEATLLQMKIKSTFEPAGEECGTLYDETVACKICGANRKQLSSLILKKGSIPKKDISKTIAGEVVVSSRFVEVIKSADIKGVEVVPINFKTNFSGYYQLIAPSEINLSPKTIAGIDPFDLSESAEGTEFIIPNGYDVKIEREIYKCPKGHTIGLNLLSEVYVFDKQINSNIDVFSSIQKVGVKRGLLRPETVFCCSQKFRKMIEEEKLTGFDFEVAHLV